MPSPLLRLAGVGLLLLGGPLAGCGLSGSAPSRSSSSIRAAATGRATVTRTVTRSVSSNPTPSSSAATTSSSTATTAKIAFCHAAELSLRYLGGQGATGHGVLSFALRNTASASCRTYGYPGVLFLDSEGASLPTHPTHTTSDFFGHTLEVPVTLAPGGEASFRLGVSHVSAGDSESGCTTAATLQVIPPDDTATLRTALGPDGAAECGGTVTVSPMQAGTGAEH